MMRGVPLESAIRRAAVDRIESRFSNDDSVLIHELGTHYGASRIDIALVNGALRGYEIKSSADRLDRLPQQVDRFGEVFNYLTLVVAEKWFDRASVLIPDWWGLIEAGGEETAHATLRERRRPRRNPDQNPHVLAALLWRPELLDVLKSIDASAGVRSATRPVLAERLVESVSRRRLGDIVRSKIKGRRDWRVDSGRLRGDERSPFGHTSSRFLARRLR
jgi:hypothetical protein